MRNQPTLSNKEEHPITANMGPSKETNDVKTTTKQAAIMKPQQQEEPEANHMLAAIDDIEKNHHRNDEEADIRAEHKRIAIGFQKLLKDRNCEKRKMMELIGTKAREAASEADDFVEDTIETIECQELYNTRRTDDFYKAQDYYEQKRGRYFTKLNEYFRTFFRGVPCGKAYFERLNAYCANVDGYTIHEESFEFAALLKAHREVTSMLHQRDELMDALFEDAKVLVRTVDLLVHWRIKTEHWACSSCTPREDVAGASILRRRTTHFKLYHYR